MSTIQKTAVLVVHYEPIMRIGLKSVIDGHPRLRVCAEADTADAARRQCEKHQPGVVFLALAPAIAWGFAMLRELRRWAPAAHFVIFTESDDALSVQRAFEAGARSYVTRTCAAAEVIAAILHALNGGLYASPRMAHLLLQNMASGSMAIRGKNEAALSERELEVFRMIGSGKSTRAVAAQFGVSIKTVETHLGRIKTKMNIGSIAELRQQAIFSNESAQPAAPAKKAHR